MQNRGEEFSDFHGHVSRTYHRHGRYEGRARVEDRRGGSRPAARTRGSALRELGIYGSKFQSVRVICFITRLHTSFIETTKNLHFEIFLSSFPFVHKFSPIFTRRKLERLDVLSSSMYQFFLCRIIRLAYDEFWRWMEVGWTSFERFVDIYIKSWNPWLVVELIYYQRVRNVSLCENEFQGTTTCCWIIF